MDHGIRCYIRRHIIRSQPEQGVRGTVGSARNRACVPLQQALSLVRPASEHGLHTFTSEFNINRESARSRQAERRRWKRLMMAGVAAGSFNPRVTARLQQSDALADGRPDSGGVLLLPDHRDGAE
jgi:hypothetical protein